MAKKKKKEKKFYFKTGSDLLDTMVGGGVGFGYPAGKIINIVGDSSSGKTFLACEIIAAAHHKYGDKVEWVYDDAESGFTFNTKDLYGFEIMPQKVEDRIRSGNVQEAYCNLRNFAENLSKDKIGIYVIDSLDGLSTEELEKIGDERMKAHKSGKEIKKGSYQMQFAKFMSQEFFRGLSGKIEDKNILLILISQTRDKIDSMFGGQTRAGGKALDFYCHTVLWLATLKKMERKGIPIGSTVKAITKKSKTPRPFRKCMFTLLFDYGLDNIGSNLDYLYELRSDKGELLKKSDSITWEGAELSAENVKAFLEKHNLVDDYKERKSSTLRKSDIIDYLIDFHKDKFEAEFGVSMTRKEMIEWIEKEGLEEKLTEKVFRKWELAESEAKSKRKKKY